MVIQQILPLGCSTSARKKAFFLLSLYPAVRGSAEGKMLINVRKCLGHYELNLHLVLRWASFGPLDLYLEYKKVCQENLRRMLGICSPGQKGPIGAPPAQMHLRKAI